MEVSDPESPRYGQHYTTEEVHELFAPAEDAVNAVKDWLVKAGVPENRISQSVNKQWIQFDASAQEAESLLQTKYHYYEHAPTGHSTIGCDQYHVHQDVKRHIDYVTPGIKLVNTRKAPPSDIRKRTFGWQKPGKILPPLLKPLPQTIERIRSATSLAKCDSVITPDCIQAMYNFTWATAAQKGNELGIFEDLGDVYSQTDLDLFFDNVEPRIPQGTRPILDSIDGATAPNPVLTAGAESNLDFQISYPIIWPQNSILFQTADPVYQANYTYQGFLNNFLDAIDGSYCITGDIEEPNLDPIYPHNVTGGYMSPEQCGVYKLTNVISISYGGAEADLPPSYQQRQCNEFMKLGMMGVTTVVASGDSGVAGPAGDDSVNGCLNSTTLGRGTVFQPDFPATCPYLLAVGSTGLTGNAAKDEVIATTRFPSGGGFSNVYPIPSYQSAAVEGYHSGPNGPTYPSYRNPTLDGLGGINGTENGIWNRAGRGYPDVSAVGDNVLIFTKGVPTLIGGTSASAPVWAALLTRINDERLKAGKSTVGFVNPTLYQNPSTMHDITVGSNPGCDTNGFSASEGWDPVTGLGTPNYPALLKIFMAL